MAAEKRKKEGEGREEWAVSCGRGRTEREAERLLGTGLYQARSVRLLPKGAHTIGAVVQLSSLGREAGAAA